MRTDGILYMNTKTHKIKKGRGVNEVFSKVRRHHYTG
jgi:hypothetical protein